MDTHQSTCIKVQASGTVHVTPDQVTLQFTISEGHKQYAACLSGLAQRVHHLRASILESGLKAEDLKTGQFQVHPQYDYQEGRQLFRGYEAVQQLHIRFPFDQHHLTEVLGLLSTSESKAEFNIQFGIASEDAHRLQALTKAFELALSRAKVLATAAGKQLGDVLLIEHIVPTAVPMERLHMRIAASTAAPDLVLDPANLNVEATVSVLWVMIN